jgi:hypothetical protein
MCSAIRKRFSWRKALQPSKFCTAFHGSQNAPAFFGSVQGEDNSHQNSYRASFPVLR